jgi:hypothetical protein
MRNQLFELEMFLSDYTDFKQYNHIDSIIETMKNKRAQDATDQKFLYTEHALEQYRLEQFKMTSKIYNEYENPPIWKPQRFWINRVQKLYPDV